MPCGALLELGWIPVRRTVRRKDEVSEDDHLELDVRLLPVLDPKRLGELFREELAKRGWKTEPDGAMTKPFGEGTARLEKDGSTIKLSVSAKRTVEAESTANGIAKEEDRAAQDAIEQKAAAQADQKLAGKRQQAREQLVRENLDKLEQQQGELVAEVDEATSATTRRALVERAGQLGSIESTTEKRTADGLELVIQVKT